MTAVAVRKTGRPTSKAVAALKAQDWQPLLAAIAQGHSIRETCASLGLDPTSLYHAMQSDQALVQRYAQACRVRAEMLADQLMIEARPRPGEDAASVNARRLYVDTLKWTASKLVPSKYGDYAGKGPDTVHLTVGELHLTALKQLQEPIQDAEIVQE